VGLQDYGTCNGTFDYELGTRLEQLGELAACKIDDIDPQKLATWLGNLWPIFEKLNEPTSQNTLTLQIEDVGKVVGVQVSTNSVQKASIAHGIVDYKELDGDCHMARVHRGRP